MTPTWLDRLMRDNLSLESFLEEISANEDALKAKMHQHIVDNKVEAARVVAGELNAWKKLRDKIRMYQREEEQNEFIQEQTG